MFADDALSLDDDKDTPDVEVLESASMSPLEQAPVSDGYVGVYRVRIEGLLQPQVQDGWQIQNVVLLSLGYDLDQGATLGPATGAIHRTMLS